MKNQGYGRIINTSSGSGLFGNFGQANYGAAKAGLIGLTRVLAVEGRKAGIRANAIAPAALTRMTEELLGAKGELLSPESIAPVVAFLASRECDLSGQILSVGGGHVAAVLLSETRGITEADLTAESVRDRLKEIFDTDGAFTPRNLGEELKELVSALEEITAGSPSPSPRSRTTSARSCAGSRGPNWHRSTWSGRPRRSSPGTPTANWRSWASWGSDSRRSTAEPGTPTPSPSASPPRHSPTVIPTSRPPRSRSGWWQRSWHMRAVRAWPSVTFLSSSPARSWRPSP